MTTPAWHDWRPLAGPLTRDAPPRRAAGPPRDGAYEVRRVRCECRDCGAHTFAPMCFTLGGGCQTCGSFDIRPIPELSSDR